MNRKKGASWVMALCLAGAASAMAQAQPVEAGERPPLSSEAARGPETGQFESKARASGEDGALLLEEALLAEHQGDSLTAATLLARACPRDTAQLRCLEAMSVLYARQGQKAAAADAARRLVALGAPPQAMGAAEILALMVGPEEALGAVMARQSAGADRKLAEWVAATALGLGQWSSAVKVAEAELARGAMSWRLSMSAAIGLAQLDRVDEARARLAQASEGGAPAPAMASAKRAVEASVARAAHSKTDAGRAK